MPELPARAREIVAAARVILDEEGRDALTMRRLAEAVGIRAPSLYKHFPDKAAVEAALIDEGFGELAAAFDHALRERGASLTTFAAAYRAFALASADLYRLMTDGPLPRDALTPGAEAGAAAPLVALCGDPDLARAAWAFAHGMAILELDDRFPAGADLDAAWRQGIMAFDAASSQAFRTDGGAGQPWHDP